MSERPQSPQQVSIPSNVGALPLDPAAQYAGIKPTTLRLYARLGWVRPTRFGRRLVFRIEELDRLLREGTPSRPSAKTEQR